MKDFKDFQEVKNWILDIDEMNGVFVGNLYFSHTYMSRQSVVVMLIGVTMFIGRIDDRLQ
jgi:hypothetical protein